MDDIEEKLLNISVEAQIEPTNIPSADETMESSSNIEPQVAYYDTIVLSGGSTKGIMTLGALQYATDNYLLTHVVNYIGTSCGAMICYLLAIGYTPIEIIVYICTNQLLERLQHFNVVSMLNGTGASSFASIHELFEKITIAKVGRLLTLKDIKEIFNKNLICVTYNLNTKKTEYLTAETHPDLPCLTAIRMSANLPLIFEKYHYNNGIYIDGGLTDNFAIDYGDKIGKKTLGIALGTNEEFNNGDNENIIEYIYKLMSIPIDQSVSLKIRNVSKKCDIIYLDYPKLKIFNFNIDAKTKLEMFSKGYQDMKNHFE